MKTTKKFSTCPQLWKEVSIDCKQFLYVETSKSESHGKGHGQCWKCTEFSLMLGKAKQKLPSLFQNDVLGSVLRNTAGKFDKAVFEPETEKLTMWQHYQAASEGGKRHIF